MTRKNKYRPLHKIIAISQVQELVDGGRWMYFKGRPISPKWVENMTFKTVSGCVKAGCFKYAGRNE